MNKMSKTQAIKEARSFVSMPYRRSRYEYVVYGPYSASDPHGPSTEYRAASYHVAISIHTEWIAKIALALMGRLSDEACFAVAYRRASEFDATVESLVNAGLDHSI